MEDERFLNGLIRQGILVPLRDRVVSHHPNGTAIICDAQTRPTSIVKDFQSTICDYLIANEAGILIASSDSRMSEGLGIDPEAVIFEPLIEVASKGLRQIVLCVNTWGSQMLAYDLDLSELIDQMIRAANHISRRVRRVDVTCVVHVPSEYGGYVNYDVTRDDWAAFYREYEIEELGRNDDPDNSQNSVEGNIGSMDDQDFDDESNLYSRHVSTL